MSKETKRNRSKESGYIGVDLIKGGDTTLFDRFLQEVESDPELNQSLLIRIALKEYFERKDAKK